MTVTQIQSLNVRFCTTYIQVEARTQRSSVSCTTSFSATNLLWWRTIVFETFSTALFILIRLIGF